MDQTSFSINGLFSIADSKRLDMENNTEIMEIILLGDEPVKELITERNENNVNLQVVELSDRRSKMALLRQLKLDSPPSDDPTVDENRQTDKTEGLSENMDIFAKLPPGTILMRQGQKTNSYQEIVNQQKPLQKIAEATSSGSTTAGAPMENPKRIQRTIRNKKTVEVRRNPIRVSKKNLDKDFVNPRQRLLSAKRKENLTNSEPAKRVKLSSTPYMNTRSVTRKLYTVGATYQAPTIHDAMEWKEWPVHGMHERPVYHPRVGLAVEYIGRFFTSLDGRSYREILKEPEVEVISVNPCDKIADSLDLKKASRRRTKKLDFQVNDGKESKSFESCMHTSLHSVLAYCAQVSNPAYYKIIQGKLENFETKPSIKECNQELQKDSDLKNEVESGSATDKIINLVKTNSINTKTTSLILNEEQNQHGENEVSFKKSNSKVSNLVSTRFEPTKCLITPRSSSNTTTNLQSGYSKLQDVIRRSSTNSLILVKDQEPTTRDNSKLSLFNDHFFEPTSSELNLELTKLDDSAISDETLMEMSSIYEKLVPVEEVNPNPEQSLKSCEVERTDSEIKTCEKKNESKDNDPNKNQTSEIAKILSEYIQSINKVPEAQNCVMQAELQNSENKIGFNNEEQWVENVKVAENKILRKYTGFKKHNMESNESVTTKPEIKETSEVFDLLNIREKSTDVECLQNLIENTAILYCAATGVHQSNVADYIKTLDLKRSVGWLKYHNS